MADITTYPLVRHLRGTPTLHVRHLRRGQLVHDGTGLAFFFRSMTGSCRCCSTPGRLTSTI